MTMWCQLHRSAWEPRLFDADDGELTRRDGSPNRFSGRRN